MSSPWVVICKSCGCTVTCFAVDPQAEHMRPEDTPPQQAALVTCPCCWKMFRYAGDEIGRGRPAQNPACARRKPPERNADGAILVAASIVAAIRLRGQEIAPSPKLNAVVHDSILLARTILAQLERR